MRQFLSGTPRQASLSLCTFCRPPGDHPDAVLHDLDPLDLPAEAVNREVLGIRKAHLGADGGQQFPTRKKD